MIIILCYPFSEDVVGEVRFGTNVRGFVDVQTAVNLDCGRGAVQTFDTIYLVVVGSIPAPSSYRIAQRRLQIENKWTFVSNKSPESDKIRIFFSESDVT